MRLTKEMLVETVDAVLKQQLLSDDGEVLDRKMQEALPVKGVKLTFVRIRNVIVDGLGFVMGLRFDKFMDFLSERFDVPREAFDDRLASLPGTVDERMKVMLIVSVVREHWQDVASAKVTRDFHQLVEALAAGPVAKEAVHAILSSEFGPELSMIVNLQVLGEMGALAGTRLANQDEIYRLMDRIAAEVALRLGG